MTNLTPVNKQAHLKTRIDVNQVEKQAAELHMVPVVMSEFRKLMVHYPIVVSKHAETGQFMCSALLGLDSDENLFFENGQWQGIYIPLQVTRQPFFLGNNAPQGTPEDYVMCIDSAHPAVGNDGEPLFDEHGEPSPYLQSQQNNLAQLLQGEQETQQLLQQLLQLGLLTSIRLDIELADGRPHHVNGLYSIDEDKLAQVSAEQLKQLQDNGALSAIYCLMHSTGQIYSLIDKKNKRIATGEAWFKKASGDD